MRAFRDGKVRCYCCRRWKPLSDFYESKDKTAIVQGACKLCSRSAGKLSIAVSAANRRKQVLNDLRKHLGKPHP